MFPSHDHPLLELEDPKSEASCKSREEFASLGPSLKLCWKDLLAHESIGCRGYLEDN